MRKRRYYPKYPKGKTLVVSIVSVVICSLFMAVYSNLQDTAMPVSGANKQPKYMERLVPSWREILFAGIPGLAYSAEHPQVKVKREFSMQSMLRGAVLFISSVDIKDMRSLLSNEIPILAAINPGTPTVSAMSLPNFPTFDAKNVISSSKPVIAVYHTHTSESYIPSFGKDHAPGGQRGDIVDVGEDFTNYMNNRGIKTIQSKAVNDYPSFMKAYGVSEITAKKMLDDNPSIQMIFDIHRDAGKREDTTAVVNGVTVARIMIIVGTGQPSLVQPHWQQNYAFAKLIDAKMNERYPGLSRGIEMVEWRYNEHLHPRALLIEVGAEENTKEEAMRGMQMFGDVLTEILAEGGGK